MTSGGTGQPVTAQSSIQSKMPDLGITIKNYLNWFCVFKICIIRMIDNEWLTHHNLIFKIHKFQFNYEIKVYFFKVVVLASMPVIGRPLFL